MLETLLGPLQDLLQEGLRAEALLGEEELNYYDKERVIDDKYVILTDLPDGKVEIRVRLDAAH